MAAAAVKGIKPNVKLILCRWSGTSILILKDLNRMWQTRQLALWLILSTLAKQLASLSAAGWLQRLGRTQSLGPLAAVSRWHWSVWNQSAVTHRKLVQVLESPVDTQERGPLPARVYKTSSEKR